MKCKPERAEQARSAFEAVVARSREVEGVMSFDIARDIVDPDSFIAIEVFADHAALDRQESLAVVQQTIAVLPELLSGEPEATIFHVASYEPWTGERSV